MIARISSTNKERKVEAVTIIKRLRIKPKYLYVNITPKTILAMSC